MAFIDIDVTKNIKTIDCWMQGEKNAEGVHFDISTWIETYGAGTAYIYIRRNGDETAYFRAMEVTDGVAEWLFSAADTAKAGDGRAQAVYITTDESVVKKTNWYHTVTAESEGDPTGEDPDPYKEMATEVIARMEEAEEELTEQALGEISDAKDAALEDIQDTMFNLAPEFVTTASYSAGDIVLYIGNLYEFTANHAAGAWIGTDARQITIGGVVADLKEDFDNIKFDNPLNLYDVGFGITGATPATWSTALGTSMIVSVNPGDNVEIESLNIFSYYSVLKSLDNMVHNGSPDFATGYSGRVGYRYPTFITIPEDGHYIWVFKEYNGNNYTPTYFTINGYKVLEQLRTHITVLENAVNEIKITRSGNVLNSVEIIPLKVLNAYGDLNDSTSSATSGFIDVKEGDVLTATWEIGNIAFVRIVGYRRGTVIQEAAATWVYEYTVPAGIDQIRFSANNDYIRSELARVNIDGTRHLYEPYYSGYTEKIAEKNGTNISNILRYPLTTLPEYIVKNLCYKPIGSLSKGYICFVDDDGSAGTDTYYIATFIAKNVPATLALMSDSVVLQTEAGMNAVKDAVENHGFCVSQHGPFYWTTRDEYALTTFFNNEAQYWEDNEIEVHGAVAPGHLTNDMIKALVGPRFDCMRSGYDQGALPYEGYLNGPRSNLFALTSQGIPENTLEYWQNKCDVTKANKWLMIVHSHTANLTAADKTKLEAVIDYAKSINLEFVTLADVPTLL